METMNVLYTITAIMINTYLLFKIMGMIDRVVSRWNASIDDKELYRESYKESILAIKESLDALLKRFVAEGDDKAIVVKGAIDETEAIYNNFSEKKFSELILKLQEYGLVEIVEADDDNYDDDDE